MCSDAVCWAYSTTCHDRICGRKDRWDDRSAEEGSGHPQRQEDSDQGENFNHGKKPQIPGES